MSPTATHLFSLLLFLGLERGRRVGRAELVSLLFPESSGADASHNLRQLLYRARRFGAPIHTSQSTVLVDGQCVEDDLTAVLASTGLEQEHVSPGRFTLLPHYIPPTQEFSSWIEAFRDRVRPRMIRALTREIECRRARGDWSRVEEIARTLLDIDAYNETATLCLAEALARLGSKNTALALLRTFESEVGKASASLALPPRLLARRIVETQAHETLPIDTPMIGRETDIARLLAYWERASRWPFTAVQLRGTESVGKSRLAAELASTFALAAPDRCAYETFAHRQSASSLTVLGHRERAARTTRRSGMLAREPFLHLATDKSIRCWHAWRAGESGLGILSLCSVRSRNRFVRQRGFGRTATSDR